MKNLTMCNVVLYDGVDAYVRKACIIEGTEKQYKQYFESVTDCEVVKIDKLYDMTWENLIAMSQSGEKDYQYLMQDYMEYTLFNN